MVRHRDKQRLVLADRNFATLQFPQFVLLTFCSRAHERKLGNEVTEAADERCNVQSI